MGIHVSPEVEIARLDLPEMGAPAYPEFQIASGSLAGGYAASADAAPAKKPGLVGETVFNEAG